MEYRSIAEGGYHDQKINQMDHLMQTFTDTPERLEELLGEMDRPLHQVDIGLVCRLYDDMLVHHVNLDDIDTESRRKYEASESRFVKKAKNLHDRLEERFKEISDSNDSCKGQLETERYEVQADNLSTDYRRLEKIFQGCGIKTESLVGAYGDFLDQMKKLNSRLETEMRFYERRGLGTKTDMQEYKERLGEGIFAEYEAAIDLGKRTIGRRRLFSENTRLKAYVEFWSELDIVTRKHDEAANFAKKLDEYERGNDINMPRSRYETLIIIRERVEWAKKIQTARNEAHGRELQERYRYTEQMTGRIAAAKLDEIGKLRLQISRGGFTVPEKKMYEALDARERILAEQVSQQRALEKFARDFEITQKQAEIQRERRRQHEARQRTAELELKKEVCASEREKLAWTAKKEELERQYALNNIDREISGTIIIQPDRATVKRYQISNTTRVYDTFMQLERLQNNISPKGYQVIDCLRRGGDINQRFYSAAELMREHPEHPDMARIKKELAIGLTQGLLARKLETGELKPEAVETIMRFDRN